MDHDHPLTLSSTLCPSFLMSVSWCFETPLWPTCRREGEGNPQVPSHLVPGNQIGYKHAWGWGGHHLASFLPTQSSLHAQAEAGTFQQGGFGPQ